MHPEQVLTFAPGSRPSALECLAHPFFDSLRTPPLPNEVAPIKIVTNKLWPWLEPFYRSV